MGGAFRSAAGQCGSLAAAGRSLVQLGRSGSRLAAPIRRSVAVLLAIEIGVFAFLFAGSQGWIVRLAHPVSMDFVSFYAAGRLADQGHATEAYSRLAHFATEQAVLGTGIAYQYFLYPPPFLLVCAGLAHLPWALSGIVFETATLAACLAVLRRILALPWRHCLLPLLAFPAVPWVLLLGQNSFLTAGLFGLSLLLLDRRPIASGLVLAGLACKPHLALLVPVALAAGGHWRAFLSAGAGVLALCLLSTLLFGVGVWPAYFASFAASQAQLQAGVVGRFGALVTPYGAMRAFGVTHGVAMLIQAVGLASAGAVVAYLWRRRAALPLRAAALLAGALIAAPFALFYDLMLALVALCWLARYGARDEFPRWSQSLMAACWLMPLLALPLGDRHLPVGGLEAPALLLLCWHWHRIGSPVAGSGRSADRHQYGTSFARLACSASAYHSSSAKKRSARF